MTERSTPKADPCTGSGIADTYRCFLQKKVDAARLSLEMQRGISNEEMEKEFALRRAKVAK